VRTAAIYSRHRLSATLIMNLEDEYARGLAGQGFPRPIEPLEFFLVGRYSSAGTLTTFPTPIQLDVRLNPSGYHLFFDRERLGPGRTRRLFLTEGDYQIRVTSPHYQVAERRVTIPMPDLNVSTPANPDPMANYTVRLQPSHAYAFANSYPMRVAPGADCGALASQERRGATLLRGSLHTFDGEPVHGAVVSIPGRPLSYQTDERGDWVLWFPANQVSGPITVRVLLPGSAAPVEIQRVCVVHGRETSLAETALRGWVLQRGAGVEGATIAVSGQPEVVRTRADGLWTYYFPLVFADSNITVTATLAGGSSLTYAGTMVPRGTTVVPTFQFS
jgi:hypothetical protein